MPVRPYYLAAQDVGARTLRTGECLLGIIGYGAAPPPGYAPEGPFTHVAMDVLDGSPCYEAWTSAQPVEWHATERARFAIAGDTLFGTIDAGPSGDRGIEAVAFDVYARLFALADRTGHRHVIRVFNYIPAITTEENGTERYRRFNAGRHDAFAAFGRSMEAAPAACALGMQSGAPVLAFLASSQAGQPVENPRQISAYHYPACHGRRSPSFSRAMLTGSGPDRQLHISGTASIVGHESTHPGDAAAQTSEILKNLDALLGQCGFTLAGVRRSLCLKVYVRHLNDAAAIRQALAPLGPVPELMFVQADICRKELLVEIEAFCRDFGDRQT